MPRIKTWKMCRERRYKTRTAMSIATPGTADIPGVPTAATGNENMIVRVFECLFPQFFSYFRLSVNSRSLRYHSDFRRAIIPATETKQAFHLQTEETQYFSTVPMENLLTLNCS